MLLYILGLAVLSGILMISVSVIFFKTDIRLYWKEIAMFALLQMTVFTYTPYVFIWWNDFAAGNDISVYVFYLFVPVIYAPVLLYDYILYPLLFVLFKRKQQDRHCSQILQEAGVSAEVIVVEGLKNAYAMGAGKAAAVVLGKELVDRMSPDKYTSALRLLNDITGNKMNNFDIEHPRLEKRMEYIADAFERR